MHFSRILDHFHVDGTPRCFVNWNLKERYFWWSDRNYRFNIYDIIRNRSCLPDRIFFILREFLKVSYYLIANLINQPILSTAALRFDLMRLRHSHGTESKPSVSLRLKGSQNTLSIHLWRPETRKRKDNWGSEMQSFRTVIRHRSCLHPCRLTLFLNLSSVDKFKVTPDVPNVLRSEGKLEGYAIRFPHPVSRGCPCCGQLACRGW